MEDLSLRSESDIRPPGPLLLPRVSAHLIAVLFPKSWRVAVRELQGAQPFYRFPGAKMGNDQTPGIGCSAVSGSPSGWVASNTYSRSLDISACAAKRLSRSLCLDLMTRFNHGEADGLHVHLPARAPGKYAYARVLPGGGAL